MTSTQDTKEQAQQTVTTAVDEGKHVAAVVGEEAHNVAGQAKDQVRVLMDDALGQVDEQSRVQRDRIIGTLQSLSGDLDDMASSGNPGLATQLAQQVADRARTLSAHLDGRDPADLLDDVRRFARRRPGLFLLGGLGAGVVVGRLAKGAKQANGHDSSPTPTNASELTGIATSGQTSAQTTTAPTYGQPVAAVPSPPVEPTAPDTGGLGSMPAPARTEDASDENGSGPGPQGFRP